MLTSKLQIEANLVYKFFYDQIRSLIIFMPSHGTFWASFHSRGLKNEIFFRPFSVY